MSSVRVQYDGYEQQVKKTKPKNDTTISSKVVTHQQKTYFFISIYVHINPYNHFRQKMSSCQEKRNALIFS